MGFSKRKTIELTLNNGWRIDAVEFRDFLILKGHSRLAAVARSIFDAKFEFVDEVIATEVEVCVAINRAFDSKIQTAIESLEFGDSNDSDIAVHGLGIWFSDEFDDWPAISKHTGLSKDEYIDRLLDCEFNVAMIGFLPGFVYLGGLPDELHVPRKSSPATRTQPSTFAIGGKYGGIYALPSAAGWNCVGRIAERLFDPNLLPPLSIAQGDIVKLKRVDAIGFREASTGQKNVRPQPAVEQNGSLTFRKTGVLTMVQDRGRKGLAYFAIPGSGAMDSSSADLANTILGNSANSPVIECHFAAPTIRFNSAATICLTGANMQWRIDGEKTARDRTIEIQPGSELTGAAAKKGCRAYIGISGEIQTTTNFGSSACYMPGKLGGNEGRPFSSGDQLFWIPPNDPTFSLHLDFSSTASDGPLELIPGPEFDLLDKGSQKALFTDSFQITTSSDRMGARLSGPTLSSATKQLGDSVPLLPGMIQLTPEGQCIVLLQDGQTTGGYPRIGYLGCKAVQRLNQTKIGHPFYFRMAE